MLSKPYLADLVFRGFRKYRFDSIISAHFMRNHLMIMQIGNEIHIFAWCKFVLYVSGYQSFLECHLQETNSSDMLTSEAITSRLWDLMVIIGSDIKAVKLLCHLLMAN